VYWVYWAGLGVLVFNAVVFVRHQVRGVWACAVVLLVFFAGAVLSVRSSAIVRAVETGSTAHARLFLWFGADANLRKQHDSMLIIAIDEGDLTTARLLLEHGADPNAQTSEVMASTPVLSKAAAIGRTDLIELLLDWGAAVDLPNNWGETALGRAARAGQVAAARLLLSRGANPNHVDDYGHRPVDAAREAHHSDAERVLAP
jgi:ankyrin repeat protein